MTTIPQQSRPYDRSSYLLVVDDDETLLKFFKIHLNKFFSRVIVVKSAHEALDVLRDKEIDLVISDIIMPRLNGVQLLKKIRKFDLTIPVLFISGAMLDAHMESGIESSDGFISKPFSIDQLHEFIETGMDRRTKLKELSEIVVDQEVLKKLLTSKVSVEKLVSEPKKCSKARALMKQLAS